MRIPAHKATSTLTHLVEAEDKSTLMEGEPSNPEIYTCFPPPRDKKVKKTKLFLKMHHEGFCRFPIGTNPSSIADTRSCWNKQFELAAELWAECKIVTRKVKGISSVYDCTGIEESEFVKAMNRLLLKIKLHRYHAGLNENHFSMLFQVLQCFRDSPMGENEFIFAIMALAMPASEIKNSSQPKNITSVINLLHSNLKNSKISDINFAGMQSDSYAYHSYSRLYGFGFCLYLSEPRLELGEVRGLNLRLAFARPIAVSTTEGNMIWTECTNLIVEDKASVNGCSFIDFDGKKHPDLKWLQPAIKQIIDSPRMMDKHVVEHRLKTDAFGCSNCGNTHVLARGGRCYSCLNYQPSNLLSTPQRFWICCENELPLGCRCSTCQSSAPKELIPREPNGWFCPCCDTICETHESICLDCKEEVAGLPKIVPLEKLKDRYKICPLPEIPSSKAKTTKEEINKMDTDSDMTSSAATASMGQRM